MLIKWQVAFAETHLSFFLETVSKLHLASNGRVAIQFKMLTYYVYAPLLKRIDALPLNAIYNFETFYSVKKHA